MPNEKFFNPASVINDSSGVGLLGSFSSSEVFLQAPPAITSISIYMTYRFIKIRFTLELKVDAKLDRTQVGDRVIICDDICSRAYRAVTLAVLCRCGFGIKSFVICNVQQVPARSGKGYAFYPGHLQ